MSEAMKFSPSPRPDDQRDFPVWPPPGQSGSEVRIRTRASEPSAWSHDPAHRFVERQVRHLLDHVGDDFGVGVGRELVAAGRAVAP